MKKLLRSIYLNNLGTKKLYKDKEYQNKQYKNSTNLEKRVQI